MECRRMRHFIWVLHCLTNINDLRLKIRSTINSQPMCVPQLLRGNGISLSQICHCVGFRYPVMKSQKMFKLVC